MSDKSPLVSVIVYNRNYGPFLEECLQSVVEQTYENVEILFTDNASTDESWEVALDFSRRHPDRMSISRHRKNIGSSANFRHWHSQLNGSYYIGLCSDDVLDPSCINRCVGLMENNKDCAFTIFSRSILNELSTNFTEPPLLDRDCILDPPSLALLYMMTVFNSSNSQVFYRATQSPHNTVIPLYEEGQFRSFFRTRVQDFLLALEHPVIFLTDPLVKQRIHKNNHGRFAEQHLLDVMGQYALNFEFREHVEILKPGLLEVFDEQLILATKKHAGTAIRYAARFLIDGNQLLAERYLHLALSLDVGISDQDEFKLVKNFLDIENEIPLDEITKQLKNAPNLVQRQRSYEPPKPWRHLE